MNLDRILPERRFDMACAAGADDSREALRRALHEETSFPMVRWRVVGDVQGDGVHLWYSLRKRPPSLAPELVAQWQTTDGGGARLVGRFTQNRRMAIAVGGVGGILALGLLSVAFQGGVPLHWALIGGSVLLGYPWLAWFMYENHIAKIEGLVKRALDGAGGAPVDAAAEAVADEVR